MRRLVVGLGAALAVATGATSPRAEAADAEEKARIALGPYVAATAGDSGGKVDLGIEAFPTGPTPWGFRVIASASKNDPSSGPATLSSEAGTIGIKGQLLFEQGLGARHGTKVTEESLSISRFGGSFQPQLDVAQYSYNPGGGPKTTGIYGSWKADVHLWWFGTLGRAEAVGSRELTTLDASGHRIPTMVTDYAAWFGQPQLILSYGRAYQQAETSYVVRPPDSNGLQLAKPERLTAPSTKPQFSALIAFPFEPPRGRFAFAPVGKLSTVGHAGDTDPTGGSGRVRAELWLYYFAFEEDKTAVRVGVAPFIDARTGGSDGLDGFLAGALFELRTSVSRLEY